MNKIQLLIAALLILNIGLLFRNSPIQATESEQGIELEYS